MTFLLAVLLAAAPAGASPAPKAPQLVDATAVVPELALELRYATEDNFLKKRLYERPVCLLRPEVAQRLARAQRTLMKQGFRLKAWDCYRPLSVQREMWNAVPVRGLVAPPDRGGSNHNRGAAIDCTLVTLAGEPVEMPTDFDSFTREAHATSPLPSKAARRHRDLLRAAMLEAGFTPVRLEWWHYDAPDAKSFPTLDAPLR
ncbi:MAG: M15 family metallopeptidase [Myxococcales bacterium]